MNGNKCIKKKHSSTQLFRFDYTYNAVGTLASWELQADSNTPTQYALGYDAADQLTSAVQNVTGTSTTVSSNAYNYDPAGNRVSEITLTGTTVGQFNNVNQLTGLSGTTTSTTVAGHTDVPVTGVGVTDYTGTLVSAAITSSTNFTANVSLPAGTNVVSVVATPSGTVNAVTTSHYQVTATGTMATSLTYDANGNTTTDENGNTYQWDALNRLMAIVYNSGPNSGTHTEFAYDGLSRRVQIVERAGTTVGAGTVSSTKNYLWVGSEIAEERDASNAVTKRFFPQGEQQSGTNYYYTSDHLGSTREVCNSSGGIVARYSYDPYGRTTLVSGSNLATFQYTHDYYHATSGLNLTKYRAYDPNTARWLARDPLGENGGMNLYDYVKNNPVDLTDPLGLCTCAELKKGMDDALGGLVNDYMMVEANHYDDVALYNKLSQAATTLGMGGKTLGKNCAIDTWENSPESLKMQSDQWNDNIYLAFHGGTAKQIRNNNATWELNRQMAFIDWAKDQWKKQGCDKCKSQ